MTSLLVMRNTPFGYICKIQIQTHSLEGFLRPLDEIMTRMEKTDSRYLGTGDMIVYVFLMMK